MTTLTLMNSSQPPAAATAAGTGVPAQDAATAGDGESDFAGLLDSGIGRLTQDRVAAQADAHRAVDDSGISPACDPAAFDPAALLQAIAAGQTTAQTRHAVTDQAMTDQAIAATAVSPMAAAMAGETSRPQPAVPASARAVAAATSKLLDATQATDADAQTPGAAQDPKADAARRATGRKEGAAYGAPETAQPGAGTGPVAAVKPEVSGAREPVRPNPPSTSLNANAPLPGAAPLHTPMPATVAAHVDVLAQPFGTPAWDDGLSTQVIWMAKNDVQSAQIRLNPEDLGPIEIKLTLTNDPAGNHSSAAVQFSALHAATREAIESALPRLREMLEAGGIALGQTSVDAGTAGNGQAFAEPGWQSADMPRATTERPRGSVLEPAAGPHARRGNGLVDTFA